MSYNPSPGGTPTINNGSITNAKLANDSIVIAGTDAALGETVTLDTITGLSTAGVVVRTGANTLEALPYSGNANKVVRVNSGATAFELATIAGGGHTTGLTTVDFGAFPGASDASVTVTGQTGILAGSQVNAWIVATATADHSADEHWIETIAVTAGNISPGVGFTIYARNTGTLAEPVLEQWANTRLAGPGVGIKQIRPDKGGGTGTRLYGQFTVAWQWI